MAITPEDLKIRFDSGTITKLAAGYAGGADDLISKIIDGETAAVGAKLQKRYGWPLPETSPHIGLINSIILDLATYKFWLRARQDNEAMNALFKSAMDQLNRLSEGKDDLGTDPATDDNSVRNAKGDGATLAFSISLMRENL